MVDTVLSTGLDGVRAGISSAQQAARDIVAATTVDDTNTSRDVAESSPAAIVDLTEAVVQLSASENQVRASAAVVETADEILGTLLDINA